MPTSMITTATTRRLAGDWAGACAAAHVDVDLDLRTVNDRHGRAFTSRLRADLRRLAPDLLRWHLPRTITDGLLRPGLTMSLARYPTQDGDVHLVARTAPAWAEAGQRISLALWDPVTNRPGPHPWPRPDRRFRLDLHPHLWAADQAPELRERCGADDVGRAGPSVPAPPSPTPDWTAELPASRGYAAHRWLAEAALLRAADRFTGPVAVRLNNGRRLRLDTGGPAPLPTSPREGGQDPVLPYAATWLPPDLELLHAGLLSPELLHPLVAAALSCVPPATGPHLRGTGSPPPATGRPPGLRLVECGGETHRLTITDGRLVPLDHPAAELRREELLMMFGGPPLRCLQVISADSRSPLWLDDVRACLDHGDLDGALALVAERLGPDAELDGALREAFDEAADGLAEHRIYRAGLLAAQTPAHLAAPLGLHPHKTGRRGRHRRLPKRGPATS